MDNYGDDSSGSQRVYSNNNNYFALDAKTVMEWNEIRSDKKKKQSSRKGVYFCDERHKSTGFESTKNIQKKIAKWRMRERMKTGCVSLVYCLNIGVDPPDLIKTDPCARMECWIDPLILPQQKALENIGKALQAQYERWQPRARYKTSLDPTVDEVKKLCMSMRRNAKDERVLFHYNGHGVPKPTNNGEIWVFNKNYTQYIPLSIYELQSWMGSPSIYVFDCSAAGLIVNWFLQFADQREKEIDRTATGGSIASIKDFIILASCGASEILPMNPDLPADVFTSCLTTPIKMALRWFISNSPLAKKDITFDIVDKIPGRLTDRRTPIGELNWIFTAITDTIAWNVLPRDLFQKLFRQDLLVASLFRNFLLAERIMRSLNCAPIAYPKLPPTFQHPMWQSWDMAVDMCLTQMPDILADVQLEYEFSPFFTDQLTAFEVWLEYGAETKKPPEQLPIVLQVLLSQTHRLRALYLLGKFLDLGSWAVNLALSVGIFPYVLKLLQSPAIELCQILVFIWTKILALDKSCQLDLVKDNGHAYFMNILASNSESIDSEQRTMAAFVLSVIANNCRPGQSACLSGNLLGICLSRLNDPDPMLRRWLILCMGKLWESFEEAKWAAVRDSAHEKLCTLLSDPVPEVRAAVVYALGTFMGGAENSEQRTNIELNLGLTLPVVTEDASPLVRKELIVALGKVMRCYEAKFREVASEMMTTNQEEKENKSGSLRRIFKTKSKAEDVPSNNNNNNIDSSSASSSSSQGTIYAVLWKILTGLVNDPFPELSRMAESYTRLILDQILPPLPPLSPSPAKKKRPGLAASLKTPLKLTQSMSTTVSAPSSPALKKTTSMIDFSKVDEDDVTVTSSLLEDSGPSSNTSNSSGFPSFYDWSAEYFSRPIMKVTDAGTNNKRFKQQRIETIVNEAKKIHSSYSSTQFSNRFDEQVAILDNSPQSTHSLIFHAFDSTIVIADDKDGISVWDKDVCNRLVNFRNKNLEDKPTIQKTTSLTFVNEHDSTRLLIGSEDGVVRVWSGYDDIDNLNIITSWKALSINTETRGVGMIFDWQQDNGFLITSGDSYILRLWDLEREMLLQDVVSGSNHIVTSLSNATPHNKCFVAGFGDGTVKLFDMRSPNKYSCVMVINEHKSSIVNLKLPKSDPTKLISGCDGGYVKFFDIRETTKPSYKTIEADGRGSMTALSIHDFAPIFATGSQTQKVKVFNFQGDELSMIRYHDGFLGQRIGPVSCLSFHPYLLLLAAGATDSIVSMYTKRAQNFV